MKLNVIILSYLLTQPKPSKSSFMKVLCIVGKLANNMYKTYEAKHYY